LYYLNATRWDGPDGRHFWHHGERRTGWHIDNHAYFLDNGYYGHEKGYGTISLKNHQTSRRCCMTASNDQRPFIDPVCGMQVDPATGTARTCYNGIQIYFCGEGCKMAFETEPQKYTQSKEKGFWRRYLDRLNKATGGRPPSCH
jgi:YHS domain-containing protein